MTSYQFSERINFQVVLWAVAGVVYRLVTMVWLVARWTAAIAYAAIAMVLWVAFLGAATAGRFLRTSQSTLLYAGKVLAITAGWAALLVGAVVLSVLYWHIVLAMAVGALAMWVTYPRTAVQP